MVLSESVFGPSLGVFAEIVGGEMGGLAEEGAELVGERIVSVGIGGEMRLGRKG